MISQSLRVFSTQELARVVYYASEHVAGVPQPLAHAYTVIFDFKDEKFAQLEFKFAKETLK